MNLENSTIYDPYRVVLNLTYKTIFNNSLYLAYIEQYKNSN